MSLKSWIITKALKGKLPGWAYRLAGRKLAKAMNMEDGMAEEKDVTIPKWKSKTVWVAVIGVVLGAIQPISTSLGHPIVIPNWVYEVLAGFGLYSLRTANISVK